MRKIGWIYSIRNKTNNKSYIGQTINDINVRYRRHLSKLRAGKHPNCHLQATFNRDGEDAFELICLLQCEDAELDHFEKLYIKLFETFEGPEGYNLTEGGAGIISKEAQDRNRISNQNNWPDVLKIDLNNNIVKRYKGQNEAALEEGVPLSNIHNSCKDKGRVVNGNYFIKESDYHTAWKPHLDLRSQPSCLVNENREVYKIFKTRREAENILGKNRSRLKDIIKNKSLILYEGQEFHLISLTHSQYYKLGVGTCIDYLREGE